MTPLIRYNIFELINNENNLLRQFKCPKNPKACPNRRNNT